MNVTIGDVATLIITVGTAITIVAGGVLALRRALHKIIVDELDKSLAPIKAELQHNSGKSLKDYIGQMRDTITANGDKIDQDRAEGTRRHRENVEELETLARGLRAVRRALLTHLRLGHRQAHAETASTGIPDELLVELDRGDEELGRYRRPPRPPGDRR